MSTGDRPIRQSRARAGGRQRYLPDGYAEEGQSCDANRATGRERDGDKSGLERENQELRRSRRELAQACERYIELYDHAPVGYLTLSVEGRIVEANLVACRMLGVKRAVLVSQSLGTFVAASGLPLLERHLRDLARADRRLSCEVEMQGKGGARFLARLASRSLRGKPGAERQLRTVIFDLAEEKKAAPQRQRVRAPADRRAGAAPAPPGSRADPAQTAEAARKLGRLTKRQSQILDQVIAGHSSKVIAAGLGIAPRTVENHRAAIMRRVGARSLPELILMVLAGAASELGPAVPDASAGRGRPRADRGR